MWSNVWNQIHPRFPPGWRQETEGGNEALSGTVGCSDRTAFIKLDGSQQVTRYETKESNSTENRHKPIHKYHISIQLMYHIIACKDQTWFDFFPGDNYQLCLQFDSVAAVGPTIWYKNQNRASWLQSPITAGNAGGRAREPVAVCGHSEVRNYPKPADKLLQVQEGWRQMSLERGQRNAPVTQHAKFKVVLVLCNNVTIFLWFTFLPECRYAKAVFSCCCHRTAYCSFRADE